MDWLREPRGRPRLQLFHRSSSPSPLCTTLWEPTRPNFCTTDGTLHQAALKLGPWPNICQHSALVAYLGSRILASSCRSMWVAPRQLFECSPCETFLWTAFHFHIGGFHPSTPYRGATRRYRVALVSWSPINLAESQGFRNRDLCRKLSRDLENTSAGHFHRTRPDSQRKRMSVLSTTVDACHDLCTWRIP